MKQAIVDAIKNKKMLEFYHNNNRRVVEPFAIGTSHKNKLVLRAYQTDGESGSRPIPEWGLFEVDKISELIVLEELFTGNREGYRRGDSVMRIIDCEIQ